MNMHPASSCVPGADQRRKERPDHDHGAGQCRPGPGNGGGHHGEQEEANYSRLEPLPETSIVPGFAPE